MSHFVYILHSKKLDKFYVGKSSNPLRRLEYHNSNDNRIWSKRGQPWQLKRVIEFENSHAASNAEVFIKRQKSRKFIESLIKSGWKVSDPD